jgi:hypothetical protein
MQHPKPAERRASFLPGMKKARIAAGFQESMAPEVGPEQKS